MMNNKQMSSKSKKFVSGGGKGMAGKMSAGPVKPGTAMGHTNGGGKFAKGGNGHMAGKTKSTPAKAC
jgi:hypothetical protein